MSQPALASSAPAPFLRRAFDWWLAQVKHALPPTIFFFIGFNLILLTKRLILQEHGVAFTIATDGPEMMQTHLRDELALLLRIGALERDEADAVNARGHAAAFVRRRG